MIRISRQCLKIGDSQWTTSEPESTRAVAGDSPLSLQATAQEEEEDEEEEEEEES